MAKQQTAVQGFGSALEVGEEAPKVKAPGSDTVTLKKSEMDKILERLANLEHGIKGEDILDEEQGMSVLIRLFEGLPVTSIATVFPRVGNDNKEELWVSFNVIKVSGEQEPKEMKYLAFLKLDKVACMVKTTRREPTVITQGYAERAHNDGRNMVKTGEKVPVRVKGSKDSFVVTLPDGREVEFNETAVN